MSYRTKALALAVGLLAMGSWSMPAAAIPDCSQRSMLTRPIELGVSGGNIHDVIKNQSGVIKDCFGGTLGSLIQNKNAKQFILSNNHVLGLENRAKRGQLIVQPGLVDTECAQTPGDAVATYTRGVHVKPGGAPNVVDAAIAEVEPGQVSANILNIGGIASTVAMPTMGMAVQKMGRTTCLTTGTITALHVNVMIEFGSGVAKFVNQIKIVGTGDTPFSAGGDSGSLIVTEGSCPQAVGLLFAGANDDSFTLANRIGAVLRALSSAPGALSMVGSCTTMATNDTDQPYDLAANLGLSNEAVKAATAVRDRHEADLMSIPGAVGTGIGVGDTPGQPVIEVYVKKLTPQAQAATPDEVDGMPVKLIETGGGVVAY
ncbi:MAG TPA: hypothetical protein VMV15_00810 [Candidatus Binataceae bacterium]|nr:hypothetical protein [Candidatus Binataceae bacterium]